MFSGIVSEIGTISAAEQKGDLRITIACSFKDIVPGESVAVNGACLTAIDPKPGQFSADLSAETVARTGASSWAKGAKVNLERSLKMGDMLSGHLVTGHIDGAAKILEITPAGDSKTLALQAPEPLSRFIAEKGSVTLDGVSLTVNKVEGARFWVNIIPHTGRETTLGARKPNDALNLEVDLIARYVHRLTQK